MYSYSPHVAPVRLLPPSLPRTAQHIMTTKLSAITKATATPLVASGFVTYQSSDPPAVAPFPPKWTEWKTTNAITQYNLYYMNMLTVKCRFPPRGMENKNDNANSNSLAHGYPMASIVVKGLKWRFLRVEWKIPKATSVQINRDKCRFFLVYGEIPKTSINRLKPFWNAWAIFGSGEYS